MTDRNEFGYPTDGYLPREQAREMQDRPLLVEMFDDTPLLPGWALWAGVVFMVCMFALAWVFA